MKPEHLERCPHYHLVPPQDDKQLIWRRDLIKAGNSDPKLARRLWTMCSEDLLFFVNSFCWTFDPRRVPSVIPFNTYEFQDEALMEIDSAVGIEDICFKKSRDMGASWMMLLVLFWRWMFCPAQSFLLVSRNADYVDKKGDDRSLFQKMDFLLDPRRMPAWLIPPYERSLFKLINRENDSAITGESTTGDVARGSRKTAIVLDEFAAFEINDGYAALSATRDATNCRIFNSTPKGQSNAFYDIAETTPIKTISLHWSLHPEKSKGLYRAHGKDRVEIIKPPLPDGYEVRCDGKLRSPWYDKECDRCVNDREIRAELDIDFLGSGSSFFEDEVDEHRRRHSCPPVTRGFVRWDPTQCVVESPPFAAINSDKAPLSLWMGLDISGRPPRDGSYVLGIDVAQGTGASNSVIHIADRRSGEQIGEFVDSQTSPEDLARLSVAIARWFNNALIIHEANAGGGQRFTRVLQDIRYSNYWVRESQGKIARKRSQDIGWWTTRQNKKVLLGDYREALQSDKFIVKSAAQLQETKGYQYLPSGGVDHVKAMTEPDPSGAKDNHGDRVIAGALCWQGIRDTRSSKPQVDKIVPGSMAWRRREWAEAKRKEQLKAKSW